MDGDVNSPDAAHPPCRSCTGSASERDLTERTLDYLSGWRNSHPVRVGNGAFDQLQLDVWGMLFDAISSRSSGPTCRSPARCGKACSLVEQCAEHRHDKDQGIWEVRGKPQDFTASKVMCWVAMDRATARRERGDDERAAKWRRSPTRSKRKSSRRASLPAAC